MSWNNNNGNKDPWGRNDGPPDIDEAIKKIKERFSFLFGSSGGGGFTSKSFFSLFSILLALWFVFGIYQVEQAERSVVLRLGKYLETKGPGLHWNPPIIDSVTKVDVVRVRPHRQDALMLTKDENI